MEDPKVENAELTRLLRRCGHFLYHQTHHSQQSAVLLLLMEHGPMNQKEIREHLSIQPGSASELITKLETKGCVERSRDEKDRRRVVLSITEKGRTVAKLHTQRPAETLFADLSEKEKQALAQLLGKLIKSWEI